MLNYVDTLLLSFYLSSSSIYIAHLKNTPPLFNLPYVFWPIYLETREQHEREREIYICTYAPSAKDPKSSLGDFSTLEKGNLPGADKVR